MIIVSAIIIGSLVVGLFIFGLIALDEARKGSMQRYHDITPCDHDPRTKPYIVDGIDDARCECGQDRTW